MMNILLTSFPDFVEILGINYKIVTDFKDWINYIQMYGDPEYTAKEKVNLSFDWFIDTAPYCREAIDSLKWFVLGGKDASRGNEKRPTLSYEQDAPLILSAFREAYQINLNSIDYMHWWEFKALFEGLSDETTIKKYMYYRSVDLNTIKDKDERKRIRKIQQQIMIKQDVTDEDIGAILWGGM